MLFFYVGIVGVSNQVLLSLICLWRFLAFLYSVDSGTDLIKGEFKKKLWFHIFLTLSTIADIPMYYGFITIEEYVDGYYGFHRLQR